MTRGHPVLPFTACLLLAGCVVLPGVGGTSCGLRDLFRTELEGHPVPCLAPGQASREDVLTTLCVPAAVFEHGEVLVYVGSSIELWVVLAGTSSSITIPFGQDYLLLVRCDAAGRVVAHHLARFDLHDVGNQLPAQYAAFGIRG